MDKNKAVKIAKANQWLGIMNNAARFRANRYETVRCLWKSLRVPSIMYGAEIMTWNQSEIDKLEVIQNKVGRVGLGANKFVGIEAIRGEMGWSTFEERVSKGVLKYKARLERMDENRNARKVYSSNYGRGRWERKCTREASKLQLKSFPDVCWI